MAGSVIHFGIVRIRVVGTGNLILTFQGYDQVLQEELAPLAMSNPNSREMRVLSNFVSQEGMLKIETRLINEIMRVNRVTIYAKPLWAEYPG